jgi:hypothetical protein
MALMEVVRISETSVYFKEPEPHGPDDGGSTHLWNVRLFQGAEATWLWWWRQYTPLKCRCTSTRLHGVMSEKAVIFMTCQIQSRVISWDVNKAMRWAAKQPWLVSHKDKDVGTETSDAQREDGKMTFEDSCMIGTDLMVYHDDDDDDDDKLCFEDTA